ncbi:MAG: succinate dehydrogenase assembly factor 2 [Gammaproteobacteria bacterium]|nr:succinate dehydrogenase assembly factor 2 [Gammaproteobacteria bacterium]
MNEMNSEARLRWQCRRGMLELDLFLREFLEKGYGRLTSDEKLTFDRMLAIGDQQLLEHLMGREPPDDKDIADVINKVRAIFTD